MIGLRQHDNVVVRGMPVGTVNSLELVPDGVVVTATMRQAIRLREGYSVAIVPSTALGGHHMEIYEGRTNGAPVMLSGVLHGEPPKIR